MILRRNEFLVISQIGNTVLLFLMNYWYFNSDVLLYISAGRNVLCNLLIKIELSTK